MKEAFVSYIRELQNKITTALEAVDGMATFQEEHWDRPGGGGGRTRVIQNGAVFEKGGVNISEVYGTLPESLKTRLKVTHSSFFACGLSLVLHPKSPMVPTVHANWRYFELYDDEGEVQDQWFGGGQDLTPYYLFDEDAVHFHEVCRAVCDQFDPEYYQMFKKQCDSYFYNAHRKEARGIGGLFFDYLRPNASISVPQHYEFVTAVGESFLNSYLPIVERRKEMTYGEAERNWQEVRRGRYVEFNLVHDRGTLFGLKTNGRIESILMSLPPVVQWPYSYEPKPDTTEARLVEVLKNPKDWLAQVELNK